MNESGQVYNYNKLRTIRTLTDIISQCIVAFAFSAFVMWDPRINLTVILLQHCLWQFRLI